MSPAVLSGVLNGLETDRCPDLLVGFDTMDDAGVYRVSPDLAVISTCDFITPPVDDPAWFGRIAAANALSDVYAMGGRPILALNLVMFPSKKLGKEVLKAILAGSYEKVIEAGAALGGGHSVDDLEPKYGLAVTGVVHPDKVLTNAGAKPGDALVLTKPIGTGVLFNANRAGKIPRTLTESMLPTVAALNKKALETASNYTIHALTDVTGFGLAGHALEIAKASQVRMTLALSQVRVYEGAYEMYQKGITTGSNKPNRAICKGLISFEKDIKPREQEILFDPQTSGGLLISLPIEEAHALVQAMRMADIPWASVIGVVEAGKPFINVKRKL
jgi:selenide,water dikinase